MLAVVLVSVYINITCTFWERFWVRVGSRPQIRQSFKIPAFAGMTTKADVPTVRASPAASIRLSPMRPFDNSFSLFVR